MLKSQAVCRLKSASALVSVMVLLSLLMVLPGCAAKEAETTKLKAMTLPFLSSYASLYIAQEEGYFAEQGLEVEFIKFNSSSEAMPLLAQGDLDVVTGSMSASLINAIASNINIRIVSGRSYVPPDQPSDALVVRKDLYQNGELDTAVELKGRRIAVPCLACLGDFTLTKILGTSGLTPADVKIIKMYMPNVITAFENEAVDAAVLDNSYSEKLEALGLAVPLTTFNEVIPGFQKTFVIFGPNLLSQHPELGKKFIVACLKGDRTYNQGKTKRNVEILHKYMDMDEETLLKAIWDPVYPDGRVKVEDILAFQQWAFENGYVDKEIEPEQFIDTRFLEYANKILNTESQ